jgi:cobaltochelatase CobN
MKSAAEQTGIELSAWSVKQLNTDPSQVENVCAGLSSADVIILYRTSDSFWEDIDAACAKLPDTVKVIVTGGDPSYWAKSTVEPGIAATVYRYLLNNGRDNFVNLLRFLLDRFSGCRVAHEAPVEVPWQGLYHPAMGNVLFSTGEYLSAYGKHLGKLPDTFVGILYSRTNWISGNLDVETKLAAAFERRGIGVIPVFYYSLKDENLGNMSGAEAVEEFLCRDGKPIVGGIVRLTSFYLGKSRGTTDESESTTGAKLLKSLNIPIFNPVISYYKNHDEWLDDPQGLGAQVAWSIAMPEFEGVIEPALIAATSNASHPAEAYKRSPTDNKIAAALKTVSSHKPPNEEKKVVIILHNNPCGSVEATVGSGAHLDTLDSVADILKRLKEEGYRVEAPESGKELIETIMKRKAISEFRWTTVEEIIAKGGSLAAVDAAQYREWFDELPEATRARMIDAWGNPPGEEKDGIPPPWCIKKDRRHRRTLRNALSASSRNGGAGARCDGQVCKILHDRCAAAHQYIATTAGSRECSARTRYPCRTHGNLEFLPARRPAFQAAACPTSPSTRCRTFTSTTQTTLLRALSRREGALPRSSIICRL